MKHILTLSALLISIVMSSCKREFEPIVYGREACAHCRMTIMDRRFAAEFIDKKGKVYKFDDLACMKHFLTENRLSEDGLLIFIADYAGSGTEFIAAQQAFFLQTEQLKSPMNGNYAAFATRAAAAKLQKEMPAEMVSWSQVK